ncbi:MAG: response regulator [Lachnospiraceae bacterium]|nr:response regulator [Lachnospiraceae bacterium]
MKSKTHKKKRIASLLLIIFISALSLGITGVYSDAEETSEESEDEKRIGGGYAVTGQLDHVGYSTQLYNSENGLPTSDANCVYATDDGYIWIGGYGGIMRYDGVSFERFDATGGMTSGRTIFEDSIGRVWVGTNDNGVVRIDDEDNQWHITYEDKLPASTIRAFAEDQNGNVFIGTTSGVAYVDKSDNVFLLDDKRINNQYVVGMCSDSDGIIYVSTNSGDTFSIEEARVSQYYTYEELGMPPINAIYSEPELPGMVYFGTDSDVVYYGKYGKKASELKEISVAPTRGIKYITRECGRIWMNSDSEIGYLDKYGNYILLENMPMNASIEMITSDYQGNMWFASSRQGVMKLVANNFQNVTAKAGIDDVVNSTCIHQDLLYVGTDKGLRILNTEAEEVKNSLTEYIGDGRIRCIIEDRNGNLWVCIYNNDMGLICYTKDNQIIRYTVDNGMLSNEMRCVREASDGTILVGSNGGLNLIKNGEIVGKYDTESGMENSVILTVEEGQDGSYFLGTDGGGIYQIKGKEMTKFSRDDGLTSDVILRVKWDPQRELYWIITSNSIEYLKDGKITNVEHFPYNNNFDIHYSDNGDVWVLSSYGIYQVNGDDMISGEAFDYKLYNMKNGLVSIPTSNAYNYIDSEGNLYISGRNGVNTVNINHFFSYNDDVLVDLKYIYCDDEIIYPNETGEYIIPSDARRIYFYPAVLDYSMANPTVKVFFEGEEDRGLIAKQSDLDALEYTKLEHGNYDLHIQVVNENTDTVIQDKKFKVVRHPRFFELLAIKILSSALLIIVTGFAVWKFMNSTIVKRQYDEIRAAKEEAERANSAKSRFLANMSHEIRTPINTIMGMNEMILREDATDVPKGYFLSIINYAVDIRNASDTLLNLINDVLDISKIESGKMHLVEQEYDVSDMLKSLCSMIRGRAIQKDLVFTVDVDELMPTRFYGDASKIKQVLLNLLTNAVKYTSVGTIKLSASVEEIDDDEYHIKYVVSDTGMGVKSEDVDKLFTAYERLDEEKNSAIQGTGLGLDISRQFAEMLEGKLWCESVYGEGSDFIFTFKQKVVDKTPLGDFDYMADEAVGPYLPQFIAPDAEILIVDDNPMNLSVIKSLLKSTKMFITTASSGEECLDKLRYGNFNIVLLDHMMPGMDGVETCKHIRENYPDLPVYALTANTTSGEEFYIQNGFDGYLAKPIDSRKLEKTIKRHLPEEIMMEVDTPEALEELEEIPDNMKWIYDVSTISVEDGIKNAGGILSFIYALQLFYETIEGNMRVIQKAYDEGDLTLYVVKVHSLKSSARIVGDMSLSHQCERLEDAGNNEKLDYIKANTSDMLADYAKYLEVLKPIEETLQKNKDEKEEIPEEELADAYAALKEVIPMMDFDSVEMIVNQVLEYKLPEEDAKFMSEIYKMLKQFKWEDMEEMIKDR